MAAFDDGLSELNAGLASRGSFARGVDNVAYDCKLVCVNSADNSDKYYVLQVIEDSGNYHLYQRWGRTGSSGQKKLTSDLNAAGAFKLFDKTYKDKTGLAWSARQVGTSALNPKAYTHLNTSSSSSGQPRPVGKWEYFLTNDPMGKPDGWYAYDAAAGAEAEQLYWDHQDNPSMHTRFIHAESSGFTYRVDLVAGQQTNTSSGKARPIKRTPPPSPPKSSTKSSKSSKAVSAAAPKKATASKAKKQKTWVLATPASPKKAAPKKAAPTKKAVSKKAVPKAAPKQAAASK